jgi:hypothetical protein
LDSFLYSAFGGHFEVVKLLLNDSRLDPTYPKSCNYTFIQTYQRNGKNKSKILDLLWQDERIKKTLKINNNTLYYLFIKKDIQNKVKKFK